LRQNANLASSRFLHIFEQYAPAILGQRVQGLGPPNIFRSKGLGFRVNYGRKLEVFNLATVFCSRNACFSAKTWKIPNSILPIPLFGPKGSGFGYHLDRPVVQSCGWSPL
jgi:hypothetical protein